MAGRPRPVALPAAFGLACALAACGGRPAASGGDPADAGDPAATDTAAAPAGPAPPCGTGRWRPGALEIHHIAVGQGDSTLIVGPTGRTLLVDVGEPRWDGSQGAAIVGAHVKAVLGCARLDAVLVTHFHADHIGFVGRGGLWHLVNVQGFEVGKLLHRNYREYLGDTSSTFANWRAYLEGEGRGRLSPEVVREGRDQIDLGPGVTFTVIASDGNGVLRAGDFSGDRAPPNENDYSVAAVLRFGALDYFIGGDVSGALSAQPAFGYTYHDVELSVAPEAGDVDVLRVSHHGSDHSSNPTFLAQLDPEVSIVSAGDGNSYGHPRPSTIERLLATGAVYLTESGDPRASASLGAAKVVGTVVVSTRDGRSYEVNGDRYQATDPVRTDADRDGYFREADPDDGRASIVPAPNGGCNPVYQACPRG